MDAKTTHDLFEDNFDKLGKRQEDLRELIK